MDLSSPSRKKGEEARLEVDTRQEPQAVQPFTRRDFFKVLSITGGALILSGCAPRYASLPTLTPTHTLLPSQTVKTDLPATPSSTLSPVETPTIVTVENPGTLPTASGVTVKINLAPPAFPADITLAQALQDRRSSRSFLQDELPLTALSALLWAGFGINRPDGKRTAPSANNVQDIDIYIASSKGLFLYQATEHALLPILPEDYRSNTGTQGFVTTAPIDLIYVSDYSRMNTSDEERMQWSFAHSGCIAQNVYLACAVLGLATVVRSSINRQDLSRRMGLKDTQHITLAQTIGYPAA